MGAGLSLFGLAVLIFFLDFLFYVGFWRCFTPLAGVFGGYFYYALSAEPPSSKRWSNVLVIGALETSRRWRWDKGRLLTRDRT